MENYACNPLLFINSSMEDFIPLDTILNLFHENDELYEFVQNVVLPPNINWGIACHGELGIARLGAYIYNKNGKIFSTNEYSIAFIEKSLYNEGWTQEEEGEIMLMACYSGLEGYNSPAAELAKTLGTPVIGALGPLWIRPDGAYYVNDEKIIDYMSPILSVDEQIHRWRRFD